MRSSKNILIYTNLNFSTFKIRVGQIKSSVRSIKYDHKTEDLMLEERESTLGFCSYRGFRKKVRFFWS